MRGRADATFLASWSGGKKPAAKYVLHAAPEQNLPEVVVKVPKLKY